MIAGNALLDAFINANILLGVGYVLWLIFRAAMRRLGLGNAHGTQLELLNAVFVAIIFAPVVVLGVQTLKTWGVASNLNVNLSDLVVSYYLNGGLQMKASDFQGLIQIRDTFTLDLLSANGPVAQGIIAVFLAGLAVGAVRLGYSVLCLSRIVAGSFQWRSIGRIRILVSDRTLVPFSTRGLRNYYVVVPAQTLAQHDELKVSLAHEFQHIRQGDLEWEVLLETLKPVFFLNPAFHAWKRQVEHLRELRCDMAVLSRGHIGIRAYCETLLSVCQNTLRRDRAFTIAVPKVTLVTAERGSRRQGAASLLEQRIKSLLSAQRPPRKRFVFAAIALPLLAAVCCATLAIQRPADWSQDRLMLSTVVNLDRLDEINRLSTFGRAGQ